MKPFLVVCGVGLLAGCGATASAVRSDPAAERAREAKVETLDRRNREQAARMRELEARLALAQAELEDLRGQRVCEQGPPRDSVHIGDGGGSEAEPEDPGPPGEPSPQPEADASRPVLRLYGTRHREPKGELEPVPDIPEGLPDRLPVAALPDEGVSDWEDAQRSSAPATPAAAEAAPIPTADPAVRAYRAALSAVRDRRFERAEGLFAMFLERYRDHAYSTHARYWHAEVLYALRRYGPALEAFGRVAREGVTSDRVAEALFKMGLCHKRLGQPGRARRIFERVKREFPGSVAARLASQEETS